MVKERVMGKTVVYGLGGFDPSKPNNNIVEIIDIPDEGENNEQQS